MKKIFYLTFIVLSFNISLFAQSKYEEGMKKGLLMLDEAKTPDDFIKVSGFFQRIADAEKKEWLPYYYAAFANNMAAMSDEKADKDKLSEKSHELADKAFALNPSDAELSCLKNMIYTTQMMVDPMSRWAKYGAMASKALADAKQIDAENPRIYYLEGQSTFNTPEMYGGGKKKAKSVFETCVAKYDAFQVKSDLHPNWGMENAKLMLQKCSE